MKLLGIKLGGKHLLPAFNLVRQNVIPRHLPGPFGWVRERIVPLVSEYVVAGLFALVWSIVYPPEGLAGTILRTIWFVILTPLFFTIGAEVAAMEGILKRLHKAEKEASGL